MALKKWVIRRKFLTACLGFFVEMPLVFSSDLPKQDESVTKPHPEAVKPFKSNPALARKVLIDGKKLVLDNLKDADSAKFRNTFASKDAVFCGEVNAKNSYGGFVGFKRVVAIPGTTIVDFDDGGIGFEAGWLGTCMGYTKAQVEAAVIKAVGR